MLGKKAIKSLTNKKRKLRSLVKSDDNFSDAETIQYTEPCKRSLVKAKKKTIKILTTNKKRKVNEE